MTDFSTARQAMVDSQIHPMGVVSEPVLESFRAVRREDFVPEGQRGIAYSDEDMRIAPGRFLMEPSTHARLLQAAAPVKSDAVLDIGCGSGYSAAILAPLTGKVVAVEPEGNLLALAKAAWATAGYENITAHQGAFAEGCDMHGPYNLIILNGSVAEIPAGLFGQLAPGGRLLAVVKKAEDRIGRAVLYLKNAHGVMGERVLFDAAVPYLPGHAPRTEFVF